MIALIVLGAVVVSVVAPTVIGVARDARPRAEFDPNYDSRRPGMVPDRLNR